MNDGTVSLGTRFLDASGGHAAVFAFHNHHHIVSPKNGLKDACDIGCNALLQLETLAHHIHDASDLAQTNHAAVRDVRNSKQQIVPYFGKVVEISAKDDSFLPHLTQAIEELLGVSSIDPDAGLLASQRQLEAATRAVEALQEAAAAQQQGFDLDAVGVCVDDALHALYQLTGEEASEAVVEEVFSKFCVGK